MTSGYARFIGRVGALAVALGVGAAVATSYGVPLAHADDTEQAPAEQPGEEQPGDGDEGGGAGNEPNEPETPQVTVNGVEVGGGAKTDAHTDSRSTVPKMNLSAQGVDQEGAKEATKEPVQKDTTKPAETATIEGSIGHTSTPAPPEEPKPPTQPVEQAVVVEPVEQVPPVDPPPVDPALDQVPPVEEAPPAEPAPAGPKPTVNEKTNPVAEQLNPTANKLAVIELDGGKATEQKLNDGGVEPLTVGDDQGEAGPATEDDGNRLMAFSNTVDNQTFSSLVAPDPNIIEPEVPNLWAGVATIPGVFLRLAATVTAAFLSPFVVIPGPISPPQPPLLWAVLSWVRREFERTLNNQTPHVVDDTTISTDEDVPVVIDALGNDGDSDEDPLTVVDFTQPANGTVSYNPVTRKFTYTPNENFSGEDTFEYAVSDQGGLPHWHGVLNGLFNVGHQASGTVTVHVEAVNDAPEAVDDVAETDEDTAVDGNVLDNDVDPDDTLTVTTPGQTIGEYGVLSLDADGSYTYTPGGRITLDTADTTTGTTTHRWVNQPTGTRNYVATTFTAGATGSYDIGQPDGDTDTLIAVYQGNFDPNDPAANLIGVDDDSGIGLKPSLTVGLVEGQQYTVVISTWDVDEPLDPSLTVNATATGDPANALDEGDEVTDTFTYAIAGGGQTDTATLTVTVAGVDDPLEAVDDFDATDEDTAVDGNVLDNDVDPDDALTVTTPGHIIGEYGVLSLNADGSYTYTPGGHIVLDSANATTGTVDYDWVGDQPGTRNYVATTFTAGASGSYDIGQPEGGPGDTIIAVYQGDFDPNDPEANLIDFNDDAVPGVTFKPNLTVNLVEGQQYTVVVSTWDDDIPVDLPLTVNATATGDPANALAPQESATDTFTYGVTNGEENATATVTVRVFGLDDAPDAISDVVETDEDTAVDGNVLGNDVDPDSPMTMTPGQTIGVYGVFSLNADGSYTYTPGGHITLDAADTTTGTTTHRWVNQPTGTRNYVATTFTAGASGSYDIGQPDGDTDTLIAVYQGNFDPNDPAANLIGVDDDSGIGLKPSLTVGLVEGQQYTVVVSTWDVDEPLDPSLTVNVTATGDPVNARPEGVWSSDDFTYTVTSGGQTDTAAVTVYIVGVNDAPTIVAVDTDADPATGTVEGTVTAIDPDGDTLTFSAPASTTYGSVVIDPFSGEFVYTPTRPLAIIPGSDFESGDFSGWTTGGTLGTPGSVIVQEGTGSYVTTGAVSFDPQPVTQAPPGVVLSDWVFTPSGNHAAALSPNGSQTFAQAGTALGLTGAQQQEIAMLSIDPQNPVGPQDAAWVTKVVHLEAGTVYTMSWNYVSTDYEPFNDGSITTLVREDGGTSTVYVNGYEGNYAILGYTNEGTGDYSTKSFGSTGWQTSAYEVTETGDYRIGFAVFNLRDQLYDPVLLLDSQPGTTTRDGMSYNPVPPNSPTAPHLVDDTFTVTVDDGNGGTDTVDVTVAVMVAGQPVAPNV